ncbi:MAG: FkbM family methyltransferase [Patescibacteria group bacterium]
MANIRKGMTVVDVGANLGYYTRLLSALVGSTGHVYAFEPDEENFAYLERNVRGLANVHIYKMAVSDTVGKVTFYHVRDMTGTHTTLPVSGADEYEVEATSLDQFMKSHAIHRIDALKIDVEGAEPQVFRGMKMLLSQKAPPLVVFEYTPAILEGFLQELQKEHQLWALNPRGSRIPLDQLTFKKGKTFFANVVLFDDKARA